MNTNKEEDTKIDRPLQSTLDLLEDYSLNTTVHGLRYIFEERRHWSERLWWLIAVTFSMIVCLWQISNLYQKWNDSPVIVSLADKSTPIWDIPFPAVTICSETKAKRNGLHFVDIFEKMVNYSFNPPDVIVSPEELRKFQSMQEVCTIKKPEFTHNGTIDGNIGDILRNITLTETIGAAEYHGQPAKESDFSETLTQEGVCYTFNMMSSKQFYQDGVVSELRGVNDDIVDNLWDPDNRYSDKPNQSYDEYFNSHPYRSFRAGTRGGLAAILLHYREDLEFVCGSALSGYRFLLHPPNEFPQIHQYFNRLPLEKSVMIGIIPTVQSTSEALRRYAPERRQCFFNNERTLKFFRVYSQRNCELECLTNYTLGKCGCVRLGMPRFNTTRNCDTSNRLCYNEAEESLLKYSLIEEKSGRPHNHYCNCLPSCMSISYDAEISQADLKLSETIAASANFEPESQKLNEYFTSTMAVFFKEKQFTEFLRSELYGPTDFLANFGGSLGLFMGISLLSAVELIYFCTLRLFFNIRRQPDNPVLQPGDNEITLQTKL